jgi:hypothetical protein
MIKMKNVNPSKLKSAAGKSTATPLKKKDAESGSKTSDEKKATKTPESY